MNISQKSAKIVKKFLGDKQMKITTMDLFDLSHSRAGAFLQTFTYPWEALSGIKQLILDLGPTLDPELYDNPGEHIWIAKSAKIAPTAFIGSPCIIGEHTEVRHGAFIRESALVGDHCVVGNSTELKNVILFDNVQVPHYNYVGDSILGFKSHMGAGSITSNVKSDSSPVVIRNFYDEDKSKQYIETHRKKFGAILGDHVEVGCNSVLNPGTVVGSYTNIYPLSLVRGIVPENSIFKTGGKVIIKEKK